MGLSQQQIDEYFENGYLVVPSFFNQQELAKLDLLVNRLQQQAEILAETQTGRVLHKGTQFSIDHINGKTQIQKIVWAGAAEPELLQLSRQSKLLVAVAQILGSDTADQLINQLHFKLPNDGVKFEWHQDSMNRRHFDPQWHDINGKGSFVQTILAIDPMTVENGTIYCVPKSHTRGDLFLDQIPDPTELKQVAGLEFAVPLLLKQGDMMFMHPYLVHGSQPNTSTKPRRVFINGFAYPGANNKPYPGEGSAQKIELE